MAVQRNTDGDIPCNAMYASEKLERQTLSHKCNANTNTNMVAVVTAVGLLGAKKVFLIL